MLRSAAIVLVVLSTTTAWSAPSPVPAKDATAHAGTRTAPKSGGSKVTLYGAVNELVMLCTAAGINLDRPALPGSVTRVNLGTPAYYSGIRKDDRVIAASIEQDVLSITFQRGKSQFRARLPVSARALRQRAAAQRQSASATADAAPPGDKHLSLAALRKYAVYLLVDKSGSMGAPNSAGKDLSNWDWCQREIVGFADDAGQYLPNGVNLIMFSDTFDDLGNQSARQVESSFQEHSPEGGTLMAKPLAHVLNKHRSQHGDSPCLIAIITDGQPGDLKELHTSLIEAANRISKQDQLIVTFLQVGGMGGGGILSDLDDKLVANGAHYDIVSVTPFGQLTRFGLGYALADAISKAGKP